MSLVDEWMGVLLLVNAATKYETKKTTSEMDIVGLF
jgi:hypothetical protein